MKLSIPMATHFPTPVPASWNTPERSRPMEQAGLFLLSIFLILAYSRVLEVVVGNAYRLPLITGGLACFCAFFGGQIRHVLRSSVARLMFMFTVWFMLCIPFAYWRAGSLTVLEDRWSRSALVFFAVATLVRTLPQLRRITLVLIVSIGIVAVLPFFYGVVYDGRLALSTGEFANSNQLAMIALIGLPFGMGVVSDQTRSKTMRFLAAVIIVLLVITTLRTGSRTGLITLALLGLVVWLNAAIQWKIVGLVAGLLIAIAAFAVLPGALVTRYSTLFSSGEDTQTAQDQEIRNSSDASTAGRLAVIREGLQYTLERPLFGLGPGNFVERRNAYYQETFGHHGYLESHNSYVQVASEMGIPGVLIFLGLLVTCYRTADRIYKHFKQQGSHSQVQLRYQALALRLIILVMGLFCFFNHIAYDLYIPTIAGLIVALESSVMSQPAVAPVAVPVPQFRPVTPPVLQPVARVTPRPRLNGTPRFLNPTRTVPLRNSRTP